MTKREIVENASGAAMEREGSVKCPRQVDGTRNRPDTRCFAVVANKIDGEDRTRQRRRPWAPQATLFAVAPPHTTILTLCDSYDCGPLAGCVGRVLEIVLTVDIELEVWTHVDNSETL
jgi:hypothetical protein